MAGFRSYTASQSAAVLPIFAICISTIIAVVAVALAIASDSKAVNEIQATADSAAVAGATAFVTLGTPKLETRLQAAHEEAVNFAVANSDYTITDLDIDAVSEDAYGQETRIHVEMEFQPANVMARVAGRSGNMAIRRRATAVATWGFPLCILTLAESGTGLSASGLAHLSAQNCIVWANSTSMNAMSFSGGKLSAQSFCAAGGVVGAGRTVPTAESACMTIPDPLADWTAPTPGACQDAGELSTIDYDEKLARYAELGIRNIQNHTPVNTNDEAALRAAAISLTEERIATNSWLVDSEGYYTIRALRGLNLVALLQVTGYLTNLDPADYAGDVYINTPTNLLSPGTYCGLDIRQGNVRMQPGVYIIKDAPLSVRRRATLTGEGVTIVLSGEKSNFSVLDEARLKITAPVDGDTAGFAIVEDDRRSLSRTPVSRLSGSGIVDAIGTIYLPRHLLSISGNGAGQQASPLLQIVARQLEMKDEGQLNINFDPSQTEVPVGIKPERTARLVN